MANVTGYLNQLREMAPDPALAEQHGTYWANAALDAPADSNTNAWARLGVNELRFPPAQTEVILAAVDSATLNGTVAESFVLTLTLRESDPKVSFAQQGKNAEILRKIKDLAEQSREQLGSQEIADAARAIEKTHSPTHELQGVPFSATLLKTIAARTFNRALNDPKISEAAAIIVEYAFSRISLKNRMSAVRTQLAHVEPTPAALEQALFLLVKIGDPAVLSAIEADTQKFRDMHMAEELKKARTGIAATERKTLFDLAVLSYSRPDDGLLALLKHKKMGYDDIAIADVLGDPDLVAFAIRALQEQETIDNQSPAMLVLSRALEQPTADDYQAINVHNATLYDISNAISVKARSDEECTFYLGDLEEAGFIERVERPTNSNPRQFPTTPPPPHRPRF
ncbi:MAG: hypothetical protein HOQ05_09180 [Corynebacteriales bacterium]|nr:hypothetical protein [Mycobacteriales bacterium]